MATRDRSASRAQEPPRETYIGWCQACGKRLFVSRKQASQAKREQHEPGLRPYRCPEQPSMFHLGHLPQRVRTGDVTADEHYGTTRKEAS